jgi:hypothetical protein
MAQRFKGTTVGGSGMNKNPLSLRDLPQRGRKNPVNITGFQPPF